VSNRPISSFLPGWLPRRPSDRTNHRLNYRDVLPDTIENAALGPKVVLHINDEDDGFLLSHLVEGAGWRILDSALSPDAAPTPTHW
jgi:hypothetical protein